MNRCFMSGARWHHDHPSFDACSEVPEVNRKLAAAQMAYHKLGPTSRKAGMLKGIHPVVLKLKQSVNDSSLNHFLKKLGEVSHKDSPQLRNGSGVEQLPSENFVMNKDAQRNKHRCLSRRRV